MNLYSVRRQIEFAGNRFIGIALQKAIEHCTLASSEPPGILAGCAKTFVWLRASEPCQVRREIDCTSEDCAKGKLELWLVGVRRNVSIDSRGQMGKDDVRVASAGNDGQDDVRMIDAKRSKIINTTRTLHIDEKDRG